MRFPFGSPSLLFGGGLLLIAGGFMGLPAADVSVPGPTASPSATATASVPPVSLDGCAETVNYDATTDSTTEFRYAFAPKVDAGSPVSQNDLYDALKDLTCENPIIASGLLAADQGDFSSLNNRPVNLVADRSVWREELRTALTHLKAASIRIVDVDAGSWTLAAYPESDLEEDVPVSIRQKKTPDDYQAVVYTVGDHNVRLLLDGGFSPVQALRFDDVAGIPKTPAATPSPSASQSAGSGSGSSGSGASAAPGTVNHDPHHNGNASQGGGTNPGLSGGASAPSGSPPARYTSPASPSASASSGSTGGRGSGSSASASPSSSPSPSRTVPPPEASAPTSSDPETGCIDPFNMGICD